MPPFELHQPTTLDEAMHIASTILQSGSSFDWVAGGTDVLPNYKWRINTKPHLISLAKIEELHVCGAQEIGAMVRLSTLENASFVHPLLSSAAKKVASSLIRKNATVGGNLCLDTRCFWYNQSEDWRRSIDWCHKADCGTGADCRVIPNQNTLCVATYQGDLAPNFIVLEAQVLLRSVNGERTLPLHEFFQLDGMKKNILQEGELLVKILLPDSAKERVGCYQKLRVRDSWDFPEAGVAASIIPGQPSTLMIASTALESIPCNHQEVVTSLFSDQQEIDINQMARAIQQSVKPVNNTALPPRYRKSMVKTLTKRALKTILGGV